MKNAEESSETSEKPGLGEWEPKILAFLCNWCSYAGADLAGVSRMQYPPNVRVVRVPCSGRVNPYFIIRALQRGWDGVLVSGCHPGDCHYISGNLVARRRFAVLKDMLEYIYDNRNTCWNLRMEAQKLIPALVPSFHSQLLLYRCHRCNFQNRTGYNLLVYSFQPCHSFNLFRIPTLQTLKKI